MSLILSQTGRNPILVLGELAVLFLLLQASPTETFSWVKEPASPTYGYLGENSTLAWNFNLSSSESISSITILRSGKKLIKLNSGGGIIKFAPYTKRVSLKGRENLTFSLYNVTVNDEADQYCCEVEYLKESQGFLQTSCAEFQVVDPPVMTSSPSNTTANVSDVISLQCTASGRPKPLITWSHAPKGHVSMTQWLNKTLIDRRDGGEYTCTANNSFGKPVSASFFLTVQYKPSIVTSPRNHSILEGTRLSLYCNATGYPEPEILWQNSAYRTIGKGNFLTLNKTDRVVSGTYTCLAVNLLGSSKANATVNIFYPPEIIHPPSRQSVTVNVTGALRLNCNVTANPIATVLIYRGLNVLNSSLGEAQYTKNDVTLDDGGEYACVAKNGHGNTTRTMVVLVRYPPLNMTVPARVDVIENSTLIISCTASGFPEPSITWTGSNGSIVSRTSLLIKKGIQREGSGDYTCEAQNVVGFARRLVTINVHYPPSIEWITPHQTINETDIILLYCNATGNPRPNIMWVKTINQGKVLLRNIGGSVFQVGKNNRSDAGTYTCSATNYLGQTHGNTTVDIQYKPDDSRLSIHDIAVINETLVLKCLADAVPQPSRYKFKVNGTTVTESSNATRVIHRVTKADQGSHECAAYNIMGWGKAAQLYVRVYERPRITAISPDVSVTINRTDSVTLQCHASGDPAPNITWSHEGAPLEHNGSILTLYNVTRREAGSYECKADNGIRKPAKASAVLSVNFAPEIERQKKKHFETSLGKAINLTCDVEGGPLPSVTWSRKRSQFSIIFSPVRMRSVLEVIPKQSRDFGDYICMARNIMGWDSHTLTLKRVDPPGAPKELAVTSFHHRVTIRWQPPDTDGGAEILGYHVMVKQKDGTGDWLLCSDVINKTEARSCIVEGLDSGKEFWVRVYARNRAGLGSEAETVARTKMLEENPSEPAASESSGLLTTESIVGIAVGGGLVLILIIVIVIVARKKKTREASFGIEMTPAPRSLNMYDNPTDGTRGMDRLPEKQEIETPYGIIRKQ